MIEEAESRNHKTDEYLGLWRVNRNGSSPKDSLRFSPENLKKLRNLEDRTQLTIGVEMISTDEFRKDYLSSSEFTLELDSSDTQPTTWAIYRKY